MTSTGELPTEREFKMGQEMSIITFGELVKELTGEPFEVIYRDYIKSQGESNETSNME